MKVTTTPPPGNNIPRAPRGAKAITMLATG